MKIKYIIEIDNKKFTVNKGELLLFSLLENNIFAQGEIKSRKRGGYCGMGVCQECLVKIGNSEKLACQTIVEKDMEVTTND